MATVNVDDIDAGLDNEGVLWFFFKDSDGIPHNVKEDELDNVLECGDDDAVFRLIEKEKE